MNWRIPVPSVPRATPRTPRTLTATFPSTPERAWIRALGISGRGRRPNRHSLCASVRAPQLRTWNLVLGRTPRECRLCGTAGVSPNSTSVHRLSNLSVVPYTQGPGWGWGAVQGAALVAEAGPTQPRGGSATCCSAHRRGAHLVGPRLGTLGGAESSGHAGYSWPL